MALLAGSARAEPNAPDPYESVNPMVGTLGGGNTIPGATRPFGMLNWSPDNPSANEYRYDRPLTRGFSLTHASGVGCPLFGDVPIMPVTEVLSSSPTLRPTPYIEGFSHIGEIAQPGRYGVTLNSGVRIDLVAAPRSGLGVFRFPAAKPATLIIDLSRNLWVVGDATVHIRGREITGSVQGRNFCWGENHYRVYFAIKVDDDAADSGTFDDYGVHPGQREGSGPKTGAYLTFAPGATVKLKVGLSYSGIDQARANLAAEIPHWNEDQLRREARADWLNRLGQVKIAAAPAADAKTFYSALYHAFVVPSVFDDVDGGYLGFDEKMHRVEHRHHLYATYSGWDIYRSQIQLVAMLAPDVGSDIGRSLLAAAQQGGGGLPRWSVANDESGVMAGDPGTIMLADLWAFGARDFDEKAALSTLLRAARDPDIHLRSYRVRPGLQSYVTRGYVAWDGGELADRVGFPPNNSASVTLEYNAADFAVARFAASLGDIATEREMLVRAGSWRTLFNPESGYIQPRGADGRFLSGFDPARTIGFTEGNAAQYSWMVLHDVGGLVTAMGGAAAVEKRLDGYFRPIGLRGENYPAAFDINNEPSFSNPWLYNWVGRPGKTQTIVANTLRAGFSGEAGGLPGNDDMGATSAWAVLAQLGLFPVIPGAGGVTFNTPAFRHVEIMFGGHKVTLTTEGVGAFVEEIRIDGQKLRRWWADWSTLANARRVVFKLSSDPNAGKVLGPPPSFPPP